MTGLKIEIEGDPIPLARARGARSGFYDPQHIAKRNFAIDVLSKIPRDKLIETPISFDLIFVIKMPKSWSLKKRAKILDSPHAQTPDIDNLVKFIFDALNGVIYNDDSQIFKVEAVKMWGESGKTIMEIVYDV
jgi:Holliday junction resolvase RusA-like endonuclease